jgi:hypothetical protein
LNTTIEEDNGALLHRRLFFLKHRKEGHGNGNLLPLPYLLQQHHIKIRQHIVVIFFFSNTKKKVITSCCFLYFNTIRKEGNGNKLSLPTSLDYHHRRR